MFMTQIRTPLVVAVMGTALIADATGFFAAQPKAIAQEKPVGKDAEHVKRLTDLLRKRRDAAKLTVEFRSKGVLDGRAVADEAFFAAALRWLDAELDLCQTRADRITVFRTHLDRMSNMDAISRALVDAGKIRASDGAVAEYYRLDAEIRLEREKSK